MFLANENFPRPSIKLLRDSGFEVKSIQEELGRNDYARLRFGIGNDFPLGQQVDYVLGKWTKEQELLLPEKINVSVEIVKSFCSSGLNNTMNNFNNK